MSKKREATVCTIKCTTQPFYRTFGIKTKSLSSLIFFPVFLRNDSVFLLSLSISLYPVEQLHKIFNIKRKSLLVPEAV